MKRLTGLILGCLILAGCQPVDEEAAKAPVTGFLDAIQEGDLEKPRSLKRTIYRV